MLGALSEVQLAQQATKLRVAADFEVYQEVGELLRPFVLSPSVGFQGY